MWNFNYGSWDSGTWQKRVKKQGSCQVIVPVPRSHFFGGYWHPQRMLLYPNNDQKKQKTLVYHICFRQLGRFLVNPNQRFPKSWGYHQFSSILDWEFPLFLPSMFILRDTPQPFSNTPKRKRNVQPPKEIIERRPNLWKSLEDHLTVGFHVKKNCCSFLICSTKETKKGYMFFFSVSVMLSLPGPNPVLAQPSQGCSEIPWPEICGMPWDADDFPWRKPCCNNFVEIFDDCHGAD